MYRQPDRPLGTTSQSVIVDRLLAGLPHAQPTNPPSHAAPRPQGRSIPHRSVIGDRYRPTARFTRDPRRSEDTALGAWGRLALGVALGVAVMFWPYSMCGLPLAGYFVGTVTVIVAAVWSAATAWRRRAPVAHIVSIGLLIWGIALAGDQILQRSGYAAASSSWICQ